MSETFQEERGNLPSASSIGRYFSCPGSYLLARDIPKEEAGEAAKKGTRIHEWLATAQGSLEDPEEQEIATRCLNQLSNVMTGLPEEVTNHTLPILEVRYWYGLKFSGQIDRLDILNDESALIVDYKTGRVGAPSAETNQQLRAYAVLAKDAFPKLKRIYAAIIQPLAGKPTVVCYQEDDLKQAEEELKNLLKEIMTPGAKLNPTEDGCKYCPAKMICPALQKDHKSLATIAAQSPAIESLTVNELSAYLLASDPVEGFIAALRSEAKRRLNEGVEVPHWMLKDGKTSRTITNAEEAFGKLQGIMDASEFTQACKVSLPQLEKNLVARGIKAKDAKIQLADLLGDTIELKTGDKILATMP